MKVVFISLNRNYILLFHILVADIETFSKHGSVKYTVCTPN